jgi:hypothetical protein
MGAAKMLAHSPIEPSDKIVILGQADGTLNASA